MAKLFLAHIIAAFTSDLEAGVVPLGQTERTVSAAAKALLEGMERGEIAHGTDVDLVIDALRGIYAWNYRPVLRDDADRPGEPPGRSFVRRHQGALTSVRLEGFDLDGDVTEGFYTGHSGAIGAGCQSVLAQHHQRGGVMPRSDAPDMQVGDAVAVGLNRAAYRRAERLTWVHVQKHPAGRLEQSDRPAGDQAGPDDSHQRVHPHPAKLAAANQTDDGQHRDGGI